MKARKMGSKLMAALMAVVMVLGLSMTAFAAGTTIDTSKTGTLTLYKYDYSAASTLANATKGSAGTGETDTEVESEYSDYAIKGVEYKILKVADIDTYTSTSGTTNNTEVVYGLNSNVANEIGLETKEAVKSETNGSETTYYWTSTQISTALEEALEKDVTDNDTTTKDALEALVNADNSGASSQTTDATGKAYWDNLAVGLYLVVETSVPDQVYSTTDPFFVSIPMTSSDGTEWNYNVVAYPKNQTDYPDITKKVRENGSGKDYTDTISASIGDTLDYRVVSKLPQITSTATYLTQYTFVDTLSAGQDYNGDVTVSFYETLADTDRTAASLTDADVTLVLNTEYTVESVTDQSTGVTTITIKLTEDGLKAVNEGAAKSTENNGKYSYIVISYTAKLNENAVLGDAGNDNDVKLTYGRTSESYTETIEDKTQVYTFGLDITKEFSGDSTDVDASDVQFTLTNSESKYITGTASTGGKYTVTGLTDDDSSTDIVFSPASNGSLYIAGLEAGEYTLTEIKTASGYNLLKNSITIVITSMEETITASTVYYTSIGAGNTVINNSEVVETPDSTNGSSSATVNGNTATMNADATVTTSKNAAVVIEITNTKGFTLPLTGGAGVWMLTILGVLIIGLGAYSLLLRKIKRA